MNDMKNMRNELNGRTTDGELSPASDGNQPESLMPSLMALNTWLLAFEQRSDAPDPR